MDELWLQERFGMGYHKDTPRRTSAALKFYVTTVLPKLASLS